jgi:hypothetical protein
LRMFLRTGCWGEYLDLRGRKCREAEEDCIMRSFIIFTLHYTLLGWSNQIKEDEIGAACSTHWRDEKCIQCSGWNTWGKHHLKDLDVNGKTILEWTSEKYCGRVWTGFICLRVRISGGILWTR